MREIRLRFAKTGLAKYISHLDINRAFQRAFLRASIPIYYTEGFNPHPYMSFSLPLSLGVESFCENVDVRVPDEMNNEDVKDRMNSVMPVGLRITDVYDNFMESEKIAYSDYVFKLEFDSNEEALSRIRKVLDSEQIMALKKAKQRKRRVMKETDIKQFVDHYNLSLRGDQIVLNIRLAAGIKVNLNPTLLLDTVLRLIEMDYEWKEISRIRLLTADLEEYR